RPLMLNAEVVDSSPLTVHVLEHSDPAQALLDYARNNRVDHLVMGARGITGMRRLLGSVSARVVAEAPCTVTVVRAPGHGRGDAAGPTSGAAALQEPKQ
ncbi:MAG: universal stress protein, partial [Lysobacter sp.]